ncbi:MAG: ComF family protein [bacterium]|nr:ComF family protein [bacterium]
MQINAHMHVSGKRGVLSHLLDFILPPVCIHCHIPIAVHGHLCAPCWQKINFITHPLCDTTGLPLPYDSEPITPELRKNRQKQFSAQALAYPPDYDRARAVALFDDVLRALIHGLKYGDRREGLGLFGRWLVVAGRELLEDTDLIMPVPLYRGRLWQRRFNQSALLSHEINRLTGVPVEVLALKRHRATRSQVGLSEHARRANVTGAFTLSQKKRNQINGQNILLIDDVLTTGSTVDACTRTLKKAGAARVDVLVLARAGNLASKL